MTISSMTTRIEVARSTGRARVRLASGAVAARLMNTGAGYAKVGLLATQALLLGGDDVRIDVRVGAGQRLDVVEIGGTVAYAADGVRSSWTIDAVLDEGAVLTWAGQPFVISDGANVLRDSKFRLAQKAVALVHETIVLGRAGEPGGALRARTRVDQAAIPLFAEDLDLSELGHRAAPGILGTARVLDQVMAFGVRPPVAIPPGQDNETGGERFDLAGPGAIIRHLGQDLARSPVPQWFSAWQPGIAATVRV